MVDSDRTSVQTYVPRYQKERWTDHADELDMSLSEFIRTMVQAGRRPFDVPSSAASEPPAEASEGGSEGDISERIVTILDSEGALDWDELVEALVDDVEADLDAALQGLQDENRVRHSGRDGGYVLATDD